MKSKIILLLLFVCSFSCAFAQTDSIKANKQNHKYKWGCAVAINSVEAQIGTPLLSSWGQALANLNVFGDKTEKSFSISIIPKYFIRSDIELRLEIGITNLQFIRNQDTKNSSYHFVSNWELNQKIYRYMPGIQWSLLKKKCIELYCGSTLFYIHYNDMEFTGYGENREISTDTLLSWERVNVTYPGGFALGIGTFIGFNLFIQKHISLGTEFSSSLLYYKIGGENNNQQTYQTLPNLPLTTEATTESNKYKGFQFSKILSSLNFSLWF